jgi:hypothetical protein
MDPEMMQAIFDTETQKELAKLAPLTIAKRLETIESLLVEIRDMMKSKNAEG